MSIEEQLSYITTRIETEDLNGNRYSGTGFFFNLNMPNGKLEPVVVTNKHVVKDMVNGTFVLTERLTTEDAPSTGTGMRINIEDFEKQWIMHPNNDVDLCVMPLKPILMLSHAKYNKHFFYRCIGEQQIPKEDDFDRINAIVEVLMIGYPHGIWDEENNKPIVRKGLTATDIKYDFQGRKEFVVDMACIPGSSGSPILLYNKGAIAKRSGGIEFGSVQFFILGVLYAGPCMTIEGKIEVKSIPTTMKSVPIVHSDVMINLGYCIKAQYLLDFVPMIQSFFRQ